MPFIDDKPVVGDCVYCEVPIILGEPAVSTETGPAHVECPDSHMCDSCDNPCLDGSKDSERGVGFCCNCLARSYEENTGRSMGRCPLCLKRHQAKI